MKDNGSQVGRVYIGLGGRMFLVWGSVGDWEEKGGGVNLIR